MEPNYKLVAKAHGHVDAEMIKIFLEAAGIPAQIFQESLGITYGLTVGSLGEVDILVPAENEAEALQLLEDMESGVLEQPPVETETEEGNQKEIDLD